MVEIPSKFLEKAVEEISKLPGIGKKTALRLALFLLKTDEHMAIDLADAIIKLRTETQLCKECHNISDVDVCQICANPARDGQIVCVTEDVRDVLAIENTGLYRGKYHVLGGLISPMEGIAPSQLKIDSLLQKVATGQVKEVILALNATMEGDTTNFYLYRKLKDYELTISTFARGLSVGDQLEYTDEITLGRSLIHRIPFEQSLPKKS
jgi:recombination protein RecR